MREVNARAQARRLAAGLTADGGPRKKLYEPAAMEKMARFGLTPDPRWVWSPK
jgi:hypothetical protein